MKKRIVIKVMKLLGIMQKHGMEKALLALLLCFSFSVAFAQLPAGSYAENFTFYEINKSTGELSTVPVSLYDYTNTRKPVFMEVFATWCPYCWNYHQTHAFQNLYAQYGPDGTDEVRVIGIEASNGNYASLSGVGVDAGGSPTQGNWLDGITYPIFPSHIGANASSYNSFYSNYGINHFPTIYVVCPNRKVYEVGQGSAEYLYYFANSNCTGYDYTQNNNAAIIDCSGINSSYYCSAQLIPSLKVQNVGAQAITSMSIEYTCNGQTAVYNWTGNLALSDVADITFPQMNIVANGMQTFTATILTVNGNADTDNEGNSYSKNFSVQLNGANAPVNEGFDNGFPDGWITAENLLSFYDVGGTHGNAMYFLCYSLSNGVQDELSLPMLNLQGQQHPTVKFSLAHKRYNTSSDHLKVMYSTDCGTTWQTPYDKSGVQLATAGSTTSSYLPSDSDWREEMVDLSAIPAADRANVIVKFVFVSGV